MGGSASEAGRACASELQLATSTPTYPPTHLTRRPAPPCRYDGASFSYNNMPFIIDARPGWPIYLAPAGTPSSIEVGGAPLRCTTGRCLPTHVLPRPAPPRPAPPRQSVRCLLPLTTLLHPPPPPNHRSSATA